MRKNKEKMNKAKKKKKMEEKEVIVEKKKIEMFIILGIWILSNV